MPHELIQFAWLLFVLAALVTGLLRLRQIETHRRMLEIIGREGLSREREAYKRVMIRFLRLTSDSEPGPATAKIARLAPRRRRRA